MTKRPIALIALAAALGATASCAPQTQNANSPVTGPTNASNTNGSGAPATFEPGSAQDIALNQPDYSAKISIKSTNSNVPAPRSMDIKIAKLGEAWRIEQMLPNVGNTITFIRPGQDTVQLLVDKKQYLEYKDGRDVNPISRTLQGLTTPGVTFQKAGSEQVGAYTTTKFKGTKADESGELTLYVAPDLRNLIVRIGIVKENVTIDATWTDISLNVTPDTVQPPADLATAYKKIDDKEFTSMFSSGEGGDATAGAAPATPPAAKQP